MNAETKTSFGRRVLETLRGRFAGGVLVTVPVVVTLYVLYILFTKVDGLLSPLLQQILGYSVPGMGLLATVVLIILAGVLTHSVLGSRLHSLGEILFIRPPLVRAIYSAVKQLVEALTSPQKKMFDQVALIEYPRKGILTLVFVSSRLVVEAKGHRGEYVTVFVPSTPAPVSGWVVLVPREDIITVDMTIEEAVKTLMSGGIAAPRKITERTPALGEERTKELIS